MLALFLFTFKLRCYAERQAQSEHFASVFHAIWRAAAALTTVGYSDVYPQMVLGRTLASAAATGSGMFALPMNLLGLGFLEAVNRRQQERRVCPHYGASLDEAAGNNPQEENESAA